MSGASTPSPLCSDRGPFLKRNYAWAVLGIGAFAQASFAAVAQGLPAIGPALRQGFDLTLPQVGFVLGALTFGGAVTLVPWGVAADRFGERRVLFAGLVGCAGALALASSVDGALPVGLFLFGAGTLGSIASVGSGRAVMGWFASSQRGFALGLRQTAVPLGGALAAVSLPAVAARSGVDAALLALASACALGAVLSALWLRNPPRREETETTVPTRPMRDRRIWRIAAGSSLLIFCQISVVSYVVLFLHGQKSMSATAAGAVLAVMQIVGAAGRVLAGRWSDRLQDRVAPLRVLALGMTASWIVVPVVLDLSNWIVLAALVAAGSVSISWNGLSFTAAAELAGADRSGTAIGMQQTVLFAMAALVAPTFGALVEWLSWRAAFALLAVPALAAWFVLKPLDKKIASLGRPIASGGDRKGVASVSPSRSSSR
ncbi:MAG: MFS transporter [Actinomycetota bacterium]|nr:MFS transporter [Actinomycetota bacterium]